MICTKNSCHGTFLQSACEMLPKPNSQELVLQNLGVHYRVPNDSLPGHYIPNNIKMLHAPYCSDGLNAGETRAEERGGAILQSSAISDDRKTTTIKWLRTLLCTGFHHQPTSLTSQRETLQPKNKRHHVPFSLTPWPLATIGGTK